MLHSTSISHDLGSKRCGSPLHQLSSKRSTSAPVAEYAHINPHQATFQHMLQKMMADHRLPDFIAHLLTAELRGSTISYGPAHRTVARGDFGGVLDRVEHDGTDYVWHVTVENDDGTTQVVPLGTLYDSWTSRWPHTNKSEIVAEKLRNTSMFIHFQIPKNDRSGGHYTLQNIIPSSIRMSPQPADVFAWLFNDMSNPIMAPPSYLQMRWEVWMSGPFSESELFDNDNVF